MSRAPAPSILGSALKVASPNNIESIIGVVPDLVIGADGVWSSVRSSIPGAPEPDFSGNIAWRFTVPFAEAPDFINGKSVQAFLALQHTQFHILSPRRNSSTSLPSLRESPLDRRGMHIPHLTRRSSCSGVCRLAPRLYWSSKKRRRTAFWLAALTNE